MGSSKHRRRRERSRSSSRSSRSSSFSSSSTSESVDSRRKHRRRGRTTHHGHERSHRRQKSKENRHDRHRNYDVNHPDHHNHDHDHRNDRGHQHRRNGSESGSDSRNKRDDKMKRRKSEKREEGVEKGRDLPSSSLLLSEDKKELLRQKILKRKREQEKDQESKVKEEAGDKRINQVKINSDAIKIENKLGKIENGEEYKIDHDQEIKTEVEFVKDLVDRGRENEESESRFGENEKVLKEIDENIDKDAKKSAQSLKERQNYVEQIEPNQELVDEPDPLDAFMETNKEIAKKEIEKAKEKENEERSFLESGGKLDPYKLLEKESAAVNKMDELKSLANNNKRCYICKKYGHTKTDCPEKRCNYCFQKGHMQVDCPKWKEELNRRAEVDKENKRKKFYEEKKKRRKEERMQELRVATGVYGFKTLYRLLELPENKLATKEDIKKSYQRLVLKWHPDKHATESEEDREFAREKYEKIKDAYELLLEGLEKGSLEGKVVGSAGNIADLDNSLRLFMEQNAVSKT